MSRWYGKPKLWVGIIYKQAENAQSGDQEQLEKEENKADMQKKREREKEFEERTQPSLGFQAF